MRFANTRLTLVAMVLLTAAACGEESPTTPTSNTDPIVLIAQLSAANEVPPVTNADANARGQATITLNVLRNASTGAVTGGGSVLYRVLLQGFPPGTVVTAAHIHSGASAVSGPILVDTSLTAATTIPLADGTGTLNLTSTAISQTNAAQIVANPAGFYFNVRTTLNPGGAVRGQLLRQ